MSNYVYHENWREYVVQFPSRKHEQGRAGYVYVLQAEDGAYKIGETRDPMQRFKTLEKKYQFQWRIALILPSCNCWNHEQYLHRYFRPKRCYGVRDWFWLEPDDLYYIEGFVVGGESCPSVS